MTIGEKQVGFRFCWAPLAACAAQQELSRQCGVTFQCKQICAPDYTYARAQIIRAVRASVVLLARSGSHARKCIFQCAREQS